MPQLFKISFSLLKLLVHATIIWRILILVPCKYWRDKSFQASLFDRMLILLCFFICYKYVQSIPHVNIKAYKAGRKKFSESQRPIFLVFCYVNMTSKFWRHVLLLPLSYKNSLMKPLYTIFIRFGVICRAPISLWKR